MTVQAADYIYYNDKEYTLIDMELGKDMAEELIDPSEKHVLSTACWRGYMAEYYIADNVLYGRTTTEEWQSVEDTESPKQRIHYTGSCVVAYNNEEMLFISDFLECYLGSDEAYELHFSDGILDEVRDLGKTILEYKKGWLDGGIERDKDGIITAAGMKQRDLLTRRDLKYKYGESTYRWRR